MDNEVASTDVSERDKIVHDSNRIDQARRDANDIIEHDGRSRTRTSFYHNDEPEGNDHTVRKFGKTYQNKWEWLYELQEERHGVENDWGKEQSKAKRDLQTWMNQLHCTDVQIEWACQIYDNIPKESGEKGYVGTISVEAVLLGIITLVLNADVSRRVRDEDQFQEIRNSCGVTKTIIKTVRKRLRPLL